MKMRNGSSLKIGTWITAPHPSVVELIANLEFDWVCIDLEHSPISKIELQTSVALIQGNNKKAFARVPYNSHLDVKYPLDSGVDGIIIPMVNSYEEAEEAISNCLYPPAGRRGVGLARAQKFGFAFDAYLEKSKDIEIFCQIEHFRAVDDIEKIVKLSGLKGIFLGPYDLSGSLGVPGQFDHPLVIEAIKRVSEVTAASGKDLGIHVIAPSHLEMMKYIKQGYNFVAFSMDTLFLGTMIRAELANLRKAITGRSDA